MNRPIFIPLVFALGFGVVGFSKKERAIKPEHDIERLEELRAQHLRTAEIEIEMAAIVERHPEWQEPTNELYQQDKAQFAALLSERMKLCKSVPNGTEWPDDVSANFWAAVDEADSINKRHPSWNVTNEGK